MASPPNSQRFTTEGEEASGHLRTHWRGRPLVSHEVIVSLIAGTRTRSGVTVHAEIDANAYPKGVVVSDAEFAAIIIDRNDFRGDWNCCIRPGP